MRPHEVRPAATRLVPEEEGRGGGSENYRARGKFEGRRLCKGVMRIGESGAGLLMLLCPFELDLCTSERDQRDTTQIQVWTQSACRSFLCLAALTFEICYGMNIRLLIFCSLHEYHRKQGQTTLYHR